MPKVRTMDLEELTTREQIEIDDLKAKLQKALEQKTDYLYDDEVAILEALHHKAHESD